jgi:hypothetical protein
MCISELDTGTNVYIINTHQYYLQVDYKNWMYHRVKLVRELRQKLELSKFREKHNKRMLITAYKQGTPQELRNYITYMKTGSGMSVFLLKTYVLINTFINNSLPLY